MSLMAKFGRGFRNKAVPIQLLNDTTPIDLTSLGASGPVELFPLDDVLTDFVASEFSVGWRLPSLDEAEAYVNNPRCYVYDSGRMVHLEGDLIHVGDLEVGANGIFHMADEYAPLTSFYSNPMPWFGGGGGVIRWGFCFGSPPDPGNHPSFIVGQQGPDTFVAGGDGLCYLSAKVDYPLATPI